MIRRVARQEMNIEWAASTQRGAVAHSICGEEAGFKVKVLYDKMKDKDTALEVSGLVALFHNGVELEQENIAHGRRAYSYNCWSGEDADR